MSTTQMLKQNYQNKNITLLNPWINRFLKYLLQVKRSEKKAQIQAEQ